MEVKRGESVYVFFSIGAVPIVGAGIWISVRADAIAQATGWGRSFIGSLMVAAVTSLPELAWGFLLMMDLISRAKKVPWRVGWGSICIITLHFFRSIALFRLGIG